MARYKKTIIFIWVCMFFISVLNGCQGADSLDAADEKLSAGSFEVEESEKGGSITLYSTVVDTTHPLFTKNIFMKDHTYMIFDKFIIVDEKGQCQESIAREWSVSDDCLTWRYVIKEDIKWHDGTSLMAEDVLFTINTIINNPDCLYAKLVENIKNVYTESGNVIIMELKKEDSLTPEKMFFPVIPKHIYENVNKNSKIKEVPIGSGPYRCSSFDAAKQMILTKNPAWNTIDKGGLDLPYLKEIIINFNSKTNSPQKQFNENETFILYAENEEAKSYIGRNDLNIYKYNTGEFTYINFNLSSYFFKDKMKRKAFTYCVDIRTIAKEVAASDVSLSLMAIAPEHYLNSGDSQNSIYDKQKAFTLFSEAGCGIIDGKVHHSSANTDEPIILTLLINNNNEERALLAEKIRLQLKDIGIYVSVLSLNWDDYIEKINSGKGFDFAIMGINLPYTPDFDLLYATDSNFNTAKYSNPDTDVILSQFKRAKNEEEKQLVAENLRKNLLEEMPYMGLFFKGEYVIYNKQLRGDIKCFREDKFYDIARWYIRAPS